MGTASVPNFIRFPLPLPSFQQPLADAVFREELALSFLRSLPGNTVV